MRRWRWAGRERQALLVGLAASSLACSSRIATQIRLDDLEFDYAFLVVLRPDGAPGRVTQPFGRDGDRITFGQQPSLELDDEDPQFVLVALTKEGLMAAEPPFDPTRASKLGVGLELPPARPTLVEASPDQPSVVRMPIPSHARLFVSDAVDGEVDAVEMRQVRLSETRLLERITLSVPVDPEHCRIRDIAPLAPFADVATPFAALYGQVVLPSFFVQGAAVDDDTVLVASATDLLLLRRGQPFVRDVKAPGAPGNFLSIRQDPADKRPIDTITSFALAPDVAPDGRREVVIVGGFDPGASDPSMRPPEGKIWRAWLGSNGIEQAETATTVAGLLARDVAIGAGGRVMLVGDLGLLYAREGYDRPFVRRPPLVAQHGPNDYANRVITVPDETYPFLAATKGALHLYDSRTDRWTFQRIFRDIVVSPKPFIWFGLTAERTQAKLRFWATASFGGLARREGTIEDWQLVDLFYPPRFEACASARSPGEPLSFNGDVTAALLHRGYLHLAFENCTAIVQVKIEDSGPGCASVAPDETGRADFTNGYYRTILPTEDGLILVSSNGAVLTTQW